MDRSSLCSKLEHKNCISKVSSKNSSWDNLGKDYYTNNINNGGEYDHNLVGAAAGARGLFSWPPTCYTCSFCKREFRSAQALGGHMNVHRRDKARLMRPHESPPRNADDQNPNLIFSSRNPNSSPSFTKFPHFASTLPQFLAPYDHIQTKDDDDDAVQIFQNFRPLITRDFMKLKDAKELSGDVGEFDRFVCEEIVKKRSEFVQLDLEIGLINGHQSDGEDLDLELRLGCN